MRRKRGSSVLFKIEEVGSRGTPRMWVVKSDFLKMTYVEMGGVPFPQEANLYSMPEV